MIKITCSILCYNYGKYLPKAIESCLNQEPGNYELEVLIIDDGSTDETPVICEWYSHKAKIIRSENKGFGTSLDRAISEASGEYVCLLDADDYFYNKKLNTILPYLQQGYLFVSHPNYFINEKGNFLDRSPGGAGNTSTLCLNREVALQLLPVKNELFFHVLKLAGHGYEIGEPLTFYRFHGNSMIRSNFRSEWQIHLASLNREVSKRLLQMSKEPPVWSDTETLKKVSQQYITRAYLNDLEAALYLNQRFQAIQNTFLMLYSVLKNNKKISKNQLKIAIRGIIGKKLE